MRWVTAEDLKDWATRLGARELTPLLVRRLIEATATAVRSLEFPVAESTHRIGFDGVADVRSGHEFLPDGVSVWEVSAEANVPGKAVADFNERSEGALPETLPNGADRSQTVYIGVSIRPWPKARRSRKPRARTSKSKSATSKGLIDVATIGNLEDFVLKARALGLWRDVRMLDAYALERWLEQRRSVGAWAARLIGKVHGDARDFEDEWELLRTQSIPVPWTPELLLAGRAQQGQEVLGKLLEPGSVTSIQADSVDESVAFVIANALVLPSGHPDRERILASALVVRDPTEANDIASEDPLILILRDEAAKFARMLASKGHACVAAIGRATLKSGGSVIHIRRSPRDAFVQALQQNGFPPESALQLARDCNGSATVLRRRVGVADKPHWAEQPSLSELAPVVLIGMFDFDSEGDRECLAELAGQSAEEYIKVLRKYLAPEVDPPILNVQSQWSLYAPADILTVAFELRIIDRALLERFASVAVKVLSERDEALSLPPDDRPFAAMRGIKRRYSGVLRNGLSESLRLLATNLEALHTELGQPGQRWLDDLVTRCPGISDDPYAMVSMGNMLSAIAETAPTTFLDALEALLRGQRDALQGILFAESENALSPGSLFVRFTGSLELIAWDPEKTDRVLDLLLALSEIDPGGRISNRPIASLAEYFLAWHPSTNASPSVRARQLDRILECASNRLAWDLIARLLPGATHSALSYNTPLWRSFDAGEPVTHADMFAAFADVVQRAIVLAGKDIERWRALVGSLTSAPREDRGRILAALETLDVDESRREAFWHLLRQEAARNQRFSDTQWAIRDADLDRLRTVAQRFAPSNLQERHRWLFDDGWPDVEIIDADGDDDEKARLRLRTAALKEILDAGGEPAILEFARTAKAVGTVVKPLETLLPPAALLRIAIESARTFSDLHFASCLSVTGRVTFGPMWGDELLAATSALPPRKRAALLVLWDDSAELLDLLQKLGRDVEEAYWSIRPPWLSTQDADLRERIVRGLLVAGRGLDVAGYVSAHSKELPTELLLMTVRSARDKLEVDPDAARVGNNTYHLAEIVRALAERDDAAEDEVIRLEFLFLRHITEPRRSHGKLAIHRAMARTPSFFMELMETIFRSENESKPVAPADEHVRAHAMQCYRLLESFTLGKNSSGEDILLGKPGALMDWVAEVRKLADAGGRRAITELQFGKLFATAPDDPNDGIRPHKSVREVIEGFHTEEVGRGFVTEIFNLRGVHSRQMNEGGEQEHALAEKWRVTAEQLDLWPHTAAIARKVSEMWRAHAEDEDVRRDKRRARGE